MARTVTQKRTGGSNGKGKSTASRQTIIARRKTNEGILFEVAHNGNIRAEA